MKMNKLHGWQRHWLVRVVLSGIGAAIFFSGCGSNSIKNPQVELDHTITTNVYSSIGDSATLATDSATFVLSSPALLLTEAVSYGASKAADIDDRKYDVTINGKVIKPGSNTIDSKGKLVVRYRGEEEIFYVRDNDYISLGYDSITRELLPYIGKNKEKK